MNKIIILFAYITQTVNLFAQPVDQHVFINEAAYSQPFLHLVNDEKYFAKNAVEAHPGFFDLSEPIKCKLHIPYGINRIWTEIEKSNTHNKGDYDYSKDFCVSIRFNFYIGGVLIAKAFKKVERPQKDDGSFTLYVDLDPLDFEQGEGEINFAYIEFLKNIKSKGSQLVMEAALSSKNVDSESYVPIACGSFYLRFDDVKYEEWKALATNYNIQLKQLADSTMKHIFGEIGFSTNFTMSCLQNPCAEGFQYSNILVSNNPCSSEPQDSCKEAIVTYNFVKKDVPLSLKMLITIKENGKIVYIENNQYGSKQISSEKQYLLSIPEIQKIFLSKFREENLEILPFGNALGYSNARLKQPVYKNGGNKLNKDSGYRMIKETKSGEDWDNGFIYSARSKDQRMQNRVYHFDAVTGKLLWITETYAVINENHRY